MHGQRPPLLIDASLSRDAERPSDTTAANQAVTEGKRLLCCQIIILEGEGAEGHAAGWRLRGSRVAHRNGRHKQWKRPLHSGLEAAFSPDIQRRLILAARYLPFTTSVDYYL